MATNKTNMGIGRAVGMAYRAPENTALPATPGEALDPAWVEIGAVSEDGITWGTGKDAEPLKNWAKKVVRVIGSDESGNVQVPFIDTTEDTLKTIFGADNVTISTATAEHGKIVSVTVAPGVSAPPAAFLFLMKDGDDLLMLGTESGVVTDLDDIGFAPTDAITWNATIEADSWTFAKDDGQTI